MPLLWGKSDQNKHFTLKFIKLREYICTSPVPFTPVPNYITCLSPGSFLLSPLPKSLMTYSRILSFAFSARAYVNSYQWQYNAAWTVRYYYYLLCSLEFISYPQEVPHTYIIQYAAIIYMPKSPWEHKKIKKLCHGPKARLPSALVVVLCIFKNIMELVASSQSQRPMDLHNSRFSSAPNLCHFLTACLCSSRNNTVKQAHTFALYRDLFFPFGNLPTYPSIHSAIYDLIRFQSRF